MVKRYNGWRIVGNLTEGGQGRIFLVEREGDSEIYVLKRLINKKRVNRFKDEIKAGLELDHPNILSVVDYNYDIDSPYIVTKYYEKGPITNLNFKMSLEDKLTFFQKIMEAMAFAHQNEVIHRDLKPENIYLKENLDPLIGDFGLCFFKDGKRFTFTDEAVGSRNYMAPELEDGKSDELTYAADVYSLGKVLYWLLSGKIFSREKHRDEEYDLTNNGDPKFYLINEYLDNMIVSEPSKRFENCCVALNELKILKRRIKMGANCIGPDIPQICIYCGLGEYKTILSYSETSDGQIDPKYAKVRNFGFNTGVNAIWRILVCDNCGNIQIFRPEFTDDFLKWIKSD